MNSESSSHSLLRRRRISSYTAVFALTFVLLIIGIYTVDNGFLEFSSVLPLKRTSTNAQNKAFSVKHRKLLNYAAGKEGDRKQNQNEKDAEPNRIWSDKCSKSDIVISQGPTEPLPNGIPTYTVEIMNVCVSGCDISAIHLSCGWFSSARLVNPRILKRLRFDDCLVNEGKPLVSGRTLSFQYANTYRYPLSVSSVSC